MASLFPPMGESFVSHLLSPFLHLPSRDFRVQAKESGRDREMRREERFEMESEWPARKVAILLLGIFDRLRPLDPQFVCVWERVFLPFGTRACSTERASFGGCSV